MIQCWNCLRFYHVMEKECPYCNSSNEVECDSTEESCDVDGDDSCLNCEYYTPDKDIVCNVLAKSIRWDRDKLDIDEPSAFKCGKWSAK